jgi:hypothetical protein
VLVVAGRGGEITLTQLPHCVFLAGPAIAHTESVGRPERGGTLAKALQPTSPFPLDRALPLPGLALDPRGAIAEPAAGGLDLRTRG